MPTYAHLWMSLPYPVASLSLGFESHLFCKQLSLETALQEHREDPWLYPSPGGVWPVPLFLPSILGLVPTSDYIPQCLTSTLRALALGSTLP